MKGWRQMALSVVALAGIAAAAPPVRVSQLGWMAGDWIEEKQGAWTEERWAPPRAGVMLGTTLSGKGDRATEFEFTRISADPSGAVDYWASPEGGAAIPFRLVSASASAVVFENPKHDYPTRIAYRREGAMLVAEISGPGGAHPMRWRYRRG